MHLQMTVVWADGGREPLEVVVDSPDDATSTDLLEGLRGPLGLDEGVWHLLAGGNPLSGLETMGSGTLIDGAVLTVGRVRATDGHVRRRPSGPTGPLSLAVVSGPDAGREIALAPGTFRVGRGNTADLTLADPDLSRVHVDVTVGPDGVHVVDCSSTNGTLVDGVRVPGTGRAVDTSATVTVGSSRLQLRTPSRRPAAVTPPRAGVRLVNRSPRVLRPPQPRTFTLPHPPQKTARARLPWVAMIAPVPVGVVLALLFTPAMLAFTLMTPLLMGATALSDRVQGRRAYAVQLGAHESAARRVRAAAALAVTEERNHRRRAVPDPVEVLATASGPTTRLWERRRHDPDMLELRLGTWTARSGVQLADPAGDSSPEPVEAPESPCALALGAAGVLGIAGPRDCVEAVARHLVGQVATLHSPRDVEVWVISADHEACSTWQWVSRLPHNRSTGSPRTRRVAVLHAFTNDLAVAIRELQCTIDERTQRLEPGRPWRGPRTVVLLDGAGTLRETPGLARLLEEGPVVGLVFIALDRDAGRLPSESRAVLDIAPDARGCRLVTDDPLAGHSLVLDRVGAWWSDRLSRALAPLRDVTPDHDVGQLPDSARLLDLLPFDALDPTSVEAAWSARPSSTLAVVGLDSEGPHSVDLRRDGPHILVGGTTGSGKSEFLQTLITSLAVVNRPDRLSFVLIDYKGGAAFKECAALPHTAGLVTDLDAHLTTRALTSLNAELRRREALFARFDARDLDHWESRAVEGQPAVPRLVIVIDEFRVLAEEFPDFISGLVRIASVGRSLGVHLVLATQRPAGVVTPDMRANINLRVALRMRDRSDSEDVLDSPAAGQISERTPGRALSRSGTGAPKPFQVARVGAAPTCAARPLRVEQLVWGAGREAATIDGPRSSSSHETRAPAQDTDLAAIALSLRTALSRMAVQPAPTPWLPALPGLVTPQDLDDRDGQPLPWKVGVGLADRPVEQRQDPLHWDLHSPGHWAAVGTAGSGRTSLLRLVAGRAAAQLGPTDLHLYAVDGGRGGLQGLEVLPHTGALVGRDDHARVARLVSRLATEVARRQGVMGRLGFGSLAEWREAAHRPDTPPAPALMLLLVDDWDLVAQTLDSHDHGALTGQVLALLRDGASAGLRALVTGDRGLLIGRIASLFSERLVLRLADPADAALAGIRLSAQVDHLPAGRAVRCSDSLEVQVAYAGTPAEQAPALVHVGALHPPPPPGLGPLRVEPLPTRVELTSLLDQPTPAGGPTVVLGVGGDDLRPLGLCAERNGRLWLVAGPPRSGRSTTLRTAGEVLLRHGRRLAVVTTRPGPLDALRSREGVACWTWSDDVRALTAAQEQEPLDVLVDDADQLIDGPADPVLREIAREARRGRWLVVCAANTATLLTQYRGLAVEVARAQTGILLSPHGPSDGELFGIRPHPTLERLPGRGVLAVEGSMTEIQVATAGTAGTCPAMA